MAGATSQRCLLLLLLPWLSLSSSRWHGTATGLVWAKLDWLRSCISVKKGAEDGFGCSHGCSHGWSSWSEEDTTVEESPLMVEPALRLDPGT